MFDLYKGSDILLPVSELFSLPLDQINFIASQLVALVFGFFFRNVFSPSVVGPKTRHVIESVAGLSLLFFCFGLQTIYLLIQTLISYLIMSWVRPSLSDKLVFAFSMSFLGAAHTYRLITDYAGYTLDITGPLMVNTQRISSLAFSYSDGYMDRKYAKERSIKSLPSLLEVFSYSLSFHSVICGPFCFFNDYLAFVEGRNMGEGPKPRPFWPMMKKIATSVTFAALFMYLTPLFYPDGLLEPELLESPYWYISFYLIMAGFAVRCRYYFAWKLADAVNFGSGLGFSGEDEQGNQNWDIIDTVDIAKVEFAVSMKNVFDGWNKVTSNWLRHIVYERTKSTYGVFMVSAYWHGFYPGYYISFAGGAFFIIISRLMRYRVRALFQINRVTSFFYDILTFAATKFLVSYLVLPFLLLELHKILAFYKNVCFMPHIIGILLFILLKLLNVISPIKKKES